MKEDGGRLHHAGDAGGAARPRVRVRRPAAACHAARAAAGHQARTRRANALLISASRSQYEKHRRPDPAARSCDAGPGADRGRADRARHTGRRAPRRRAGPLGHRPRRQRLYPPAVRLDLVRAVARSRTRTATACRTRACPDFENPLRGITGGILSRATTSRSRCCRERAQVGHRVLERPVDSVGARQQQRATRPCRARTSSRRRDSTSGNVTTDRSFSGFQAAGIDLKISPIDLRGQLRQAQHRPRGLQVLGNA